MFFCPLVTQAALLAVSAERALLADCFHAFMVTKAITSDDDTLSLPEINDGLLLTCFEAWDNFTTSAGYVASKAAEFALSKERQLVHT